MTRASLLAVLLLSTVSPAMAQQRAAAAFDAADRNGDGVISREEFEATRAENFSRRDRNQDGFIDSADLGQRAAARPALADGIGRAQQRMDVNGDGKLSKEEFVKGGLDLFERADTDGNGSIDAKELQAVRGQVRERATGGLGNKTGLLRGAVLSDPAG